jgi:hypothetical protein
LIDKFIDLASWEVQVDYRTMKLHLSILAEDLPSPSSFGKPNPFAVVTVLHKEVGVKPTVVGKT